MYGIILLLVVALISLLITRIATVALVSTGMAFEAARFQARSALSGVGFTTPEAQQVVNHPFRRRVILTLMLVGNVGLVTAIAAVLGGFLEAEGPQALTRGGALVGGLLVVYGLAKSDWVDRRLRAVIGRVLDRYSDVEVRDFASLLHVYEAYAVRDLEVREGHWLAGRSLADLELQDEGIIVIGVRRADGSYLGAPTGETVIEPGDVAIAYGHNDAFAALQDRRPGPKGEEEHRRGVEEQRRRDEEEAGEPARERDERPTGS